MLIEPEYSMHWVRWAFGNVYFAFLKLYILGSDVYNFCFWLSPAFYQRPRWKMTWWVADNWWKWSGYYSTKDCTFWSQFKTASLDFFSCWWVADHQWKWSRSSSGSSDNLSTPIRQLAFQIRRTGSKICIHGKLYSAKGEVICQGVNTCQYNYKYKIQEYANVQIQKYSVRNNLSNCEDECKLEEAGVRSQS